MIEIFLIINKFFIAKKQYGKKKTENRKHWRPQGEEGYVQEKKGWPSQKSYAAFQTNQLYDWITDLSAGR